MKTWLGLVALRLDLRLDKTPVQTNTELRKRHDCVHNKFRELRVPQSCKNFPFRELQILLLCSDVGGWISFGTIQQVNILEMWLWPKDYRIWCKKFAGKYIWNQMCESHDFYLQAPVGLCLVSLNQNESNEQSQVFHSGSQRNNWRSFQLQGKQGTGDGEMDGVKFLLSLRVNSRLGRIQELVSVQCPD